MAVLLLFLRAGTSIAEETRMDRLVGHSLTERLTQDGKWRADFTPNSATYTCLSCPSPAEARITVRSVDQNTLATFRDVYIIERKAFCANLAISFTGHCIGTATDSFRTGAPAGYRSTHVSDGQVYTEILMPYYDQFYGPEVITGTLVHDRDAAPADFAARSLTHYMRRLTLFW